MVLPLSKFSLAEITYIEANISFFIQYRCGPRTQWRPYKYLEVFSEQPFLASGLFAA